MKKRTVLALLAATWYLSDKYNTYRFARGLQVLLTEDELDTVYTRILNLKTEK